MINCNKYFDYFNTDYIINHIFYYANYLNN